MLPDEKERITTVRKFEGIDFNLNKGLNDILTLTSQICDTPLAFITLIDETSQWFKVCKGLEVMELPRSTSFCTHTIMNPGVMVINDPLADERFVGLPTVTSGMVRFYAGATLTTEDGQNIGTLCTVDNCSKELSQDKKDMLAILARQAIHLMELELSQKLLQEKTEFIAIQNKALLEIAHTQSHEFRGPLTTIMGFMNIIKDDDYNNPKEHLMMMDEAIHKLDEKIYLVVKSTQRARDIYAA